MKENNKFKMSFLNISFIIIALTLVVVGITDFISISSFAEKQAGERAEGIAVSLAENIDAEKFKDVISNGKSSPYYEELRVKMNKSLQKTGVKYVTTMLINGNKINYLVDGSEPNTEDFSDYMSEGEITNDRLMTIISSNEIGYSDMYKDETWSYLLSAVAPIIDNSGKTIAWVEADISVLDIKKEIRFFMLRLIIVLVFALTVVFFMINFIRTNIVKPIEKFLVSFRELVNGNFEKVDLKQKGIFNLLANEYNLLVEKISTIISTIKDQIKEVNEEKDSLTYDMDNIIKGKSSKYYEESYNKITNGLEQQLDFLSQLVDEVSSQNASTQNALASVEEMNTSINEVTEYVQSTKDSSLEAINIAQESFSNVTMLIEAMHQINRSMSLSNNKIDRLITLSDDIGGIVIAIQNISQRTNLLALNAAIEAARAGEAGKGFSVVADEIRKLAEQTNSETDKISNIVENVRKEIEDVKNTNDVVGEKVKEGDEITSSVKGSIESIRDITTKNNESISVINNATGEQKNAISEITQSIESISHKTQDIDSLGRDLHKGMKEIEETINRKLEVLYELKNNLEKIDEEMEFFK